MSAMILNIHGFGSNGNNRNCIFLKEEYGDRKVISPTFNYEEENPYNILNSLQNIIILNREQNTPVNLVVGSSMGGFFAYCLCAMYDVKTLLINPSLTPFLNLNMRYDVSEYICKKYTEIWCKYVYEINSANYEVIISSTDDIIDHNNLTKSILSKNKKINIVEGEHKLKLTDDVKNTIRNIVKKLQNGD